MAPTQLHAHATDATRTWSELGTRAVLIGDVEWPSVEWHTGMVMEQHIEPGEHIYNLVRF